MKVLAPLTLAFVFALLSGCSKKDIIKWSGKSRCEVSEQISIFHVKPGSDVKRTVLKKTFYPNGLVKTLSTVTSGDWTLTLYDSVQYSFEYGNNTATVHVRAVAPFASKIEEFDLTVNFDPATGYATRVGDDVLQYDNKKLTWFGTRKLEYDANGNLIAVFKETVHNTAVRFEYDLTKKSGKNDFYTAPDNYNFLGVGYCLAEMMGWIPTQSPNRRVAQIYETGGYIWSHFSFSNHTYSPDGKLIEFTNTLGGGPSYTIKNSWKCTRF